MRCARCNQYAPVNSDGHCTTCARKLAGLCAFPECSHERHGQHRHCWHHYNLLHSRPERPNLTPAEFAAEVEWLLGTDSPNHIAFGRGWPDQAVPLKRAKRKDHLGRQLLESVEAVA